MALAIGSGFGLNPGLATASLISGNKPSRIQASAVLSNDAMRFGRLDQGRRGYETSDGDRAAV